MEIKGEKISADLRSESVFVQNGGPSSSGGLEDSEGSANLLLGMMSSLCPTTLAPEGVFGQGHWGKTANDKKKVQKWEEGTFLLK